MRFFDVMTSHLFPGSGLFSAAGNHLMDETINGVQEDPFVPLLVLKTTKKALQRYILFLIVFHSSSVDYLVF